MTYKKLGQMIRYMFNPQKFFWGLFKVIIALLIVSFAVCKLLTMF